MTNPMVPREYLNVMVGDIILEEHALIGSSSIVLPNVILRHGTSVGAMSLIKKDTEPWTIYGGIPAKKIKPRNKNCMNLQIDLEKKNEQKTKFEPELHSPTKPNQDNPFNSL